MQGFHLAMNGNMKNGYKKEPVLEKKGVGSFCLF